MNPRPEDSASEEPLASGESGDGPGSRGSRERDARPRRRRRWWKVLLVVAAIGVLLLGALLAFRDQLARAIVPGVLGTSLGLRVEIDDISTSLGGNISVRGLRAGEPEEWSQVRSLRLDEVEASVSIPELIRKGIDGIEKVTVSGGELELDLDRPGPPRKEPPKEEKKKRPFPWPRRLPRVDARLDEVRLSSGEKRLKLEDVHAQTRSTTGGSTLELRTTADVDLGDRSGELPVKLSLDYRNGVVSDLSLQAGGERVVEGGRFDLRKLEGDLRLRFGDARGTVSVEGLGSEEKKAKADLALRDLPVGEVLEIALGRDVGAQGKLTLRSNARLSLENPLEGKAEVDLALSKASYRSTALPDLTLRASLEDRVVRVSSLELDGESLTIRSDGLSASLESLEPRDILRSLSGSFRVESPALARALSPFLDDPRLADFLSGASVDVAARIDGPRAVIETLEVASPDFGLSLEEGEALIDIDSPVESEVALSGALRIADLAALSPLLGEDQKPIRGSIEGSFSVRGKATRPSGSIELRGSELEAAGVPLGDLALEAGADYPSVNVEHLTLEAGASAPGDPAPFRLELSGRAQIEERRLDDLNLSLEGSDLRARASALDGAERWLPSGAYRLDLVARGPLEWPDVELSLEARGMGGANDSSPLELDLAKEGGHVSLVVESFTLPEPALTVSIDLEGDLERSPLSGSVEIRDLSMAFAGEHWKNESDALLRFDLAQRTFLLDPPLILVDGDERLVLGLFPEGEEALALRVEADLQGRLPFSPRDDVSVKVEDLDATLVARYAQRSFQKKSDLLPRSLELVVEGAGIERGQGGGGSGAEDGNALKTIGKPSNAAAGKEGGEPETRLAVAPSTDNAAAPLTPDPSLPSAEKSRSLAGRIGDVDLRVNLDRSGEGPDASVSLDISGVDLRSVPIGSPLREPLEGKLSLKASWNGERLRLDELRSDLAGVTAKAEAETRYALDLDSLLTGDREMPRPGELDARAEVLIEDLSVVRPLVPGLRRIGGGLRVQLTAAGTFENPETEAVVVAENVEARFGDMPSLFGVEARVLLTGDSARIERLAGEMGGAPFGLQGVVTDLFETPDLDVALTGKNLLLVRSDNARLRADVALHVTGDIEALRVSGKVGVTDGRVLQQVPLVEFLGTLTKQVGGLATGRAPVRAGEAAAQRAAGLKLFTLRDPPLKDTKFDVAVTAKEPLEIRGNVFRGKVRPDVTLRGTGEIPFLVGSVYVDNFVLSLPATRLVIESGGILFDEKNPLFPELSLTGTTRIRGYDVTVAITGPINEPAVVFSSSPPLPADQLMLLVTTGKPPEAGGAESDRQALFTVAKYFGMDLVRKIFGPGDIDATESILDRFDFEAGRNVSRSGQETWEARFRLARELVGERDTLFLTGERDEFDHYNVGLRIVFRGR